MGQTAFYPQVIDGSAHGGFSLTHAMAPLPEQRLALGRVSTRTCVPRRRESRSVVQVCGDAIGRTEIPSEPEG